MKAATAENLGHDCNQAISIHAAREGGDRQPVRARERMDISIHAAREGGDYIADNSVLKRYGISIHAAREGGDDCLCNRRFCQ